MKERPSPDGRVEVEISPFTDEYEVTWLAIKRAERVIALANRALKAEGIELVPLWKGLPTWSNEVTALMDQPIPRDDLLNYGHEPVISVTDAAWEVTQGRGDEIGRFMLWVYDVMGEEGRAFIHTEAINAYVTRRSEEISLMARRPPEGDEDNGKTTE